MNILKKLSKKLSVVVFLTLLSSCSTLDEATHEDTLGEATHVDKEFTVSDDICITMDVGDVTVGVSTDDKVHITYYEYDLIKYDIEHNTGKLVLIQHIENDFTGDFKGVTILIPTTLSGTFKADLAAGNITAEGITVANISLHSAAGNITVENSSAGSIGLQTTAGDIKLNRLKATGNITMHADAGNITGSIVGIRTDFTITTSASAGSVSPRSGGNGTQNLKATTGAGDININFVR